MGEFKEKYEKVCGIKDRALSLVEMQMNGNIDSVDAKELGEVADIAKDMAELMKYCAEAEYYHKVVESMDEATDEEKSYYMNKYIPEYEGKFYSPIYMGMNNYARQRDSRGRYMYTEPNWRMNYADGGMNGNSNGGNNSGSRYYTTPSNLEDMKVPRDYREGRAGITRLTYMETKDDMDASSRMTEFDHYIKDLAEDITEMVEGLSASEKSTIKAKLQTLATKIQ